VTDASFPYHPDLPHRWAFVASVLIGAGVAGMLVLGLKVAGWWRGVVLARHQVAGQDRRRGGERAMERVGQHIGSRVPEIRTGGDSRHPIGECDMVRTDVPNGARRSRRGEGPRPTGRGAGQAATMLRLMSPWASRRTSRAPRIEPFHYPFLDHYGRRRPDHEVQDELNALRERLEARRYRSQIRQLIRSSRWPSAHAVEAHPRTKTDQPSLEPNRLAGR